MFLCLLLLSTACIAFWCYTGSGSFLVFALLPVLLVWFGQAPTPPEDSAQTPPADNSDTKSDLVFKCDTNQQ